VSKLVPCPHHLPLVGGQKGQSGESRQPQLVVSQNHNIRRPGSARHVTHGGFLRWIRVRSSRSLPVVQSCLRTRGSGALAGQLNDENSKLLRCVSCPKTIDFQVQAQEVMSNRVGMRHYTCTYRADGGKQPLAQTFLGRDPDSSWEEKDIGATTAGGPKTN
jgi:hypothetical protein